MVQYKMEELLKVSSYSLNIQPYKNVIHKSVTHLYGQCFLLQIWKALEYCKKKKRDFFLKIVVASIRNSHFSFSSIFHFRLLVVLHERERWHEKLSVWLCLPDVLAFSLETSVLLWGQEETRTTPFWAQGAHGWHTTKWVFLCNNRDEKEWQLT